MYMIRLTVVKIMFVGLCGSTISLHAQTPAETDKLVLSAVVGCLAQNSNNWILTNATGPIVEPVMDGRVKAGSAVTVEKAAAQPAGKNRYRLMGLLDEFGVAESKGHKVLVKGLIVGDTNDRRINVVSVQRVASTCGEAK